MTRQVPSPPLWNDPPRSRRIGRVRRGWDETVTALRTTGRIEPVDAALVRLGRVIADQADELEHDPDVSPFVRNGLYKTMLSAIGMLLDQVHPDAELSLDDLLAGLGDPADT